MFVTQNSAASAPKPASKWARLAPDPGTQTAIPASEEILAENNHDDDDDGGGDDDETAMTILPDQTEVGARMVGRKTAFSGGKKFP